MWKLILGLVIIVILGAAAWWFGWLENLLPREQSVAVEESVTSPEQQVVNDLPTSATDASDNALTQDITAIEEELAGLGDDIIAIEESVKDTPVTGVEAEKERRLEVLSELEARVVLMSKVTPEFKQNLESNINSGREALTTFEVDEQALDESHYIYTLVVSQAYIAAAADRAATVINMIAGVGVKLQARLGTAQSEGTDIEGFVSTLAQMGASLQSAQAHAQVAIDTVATLAPTESNESVSANTEALAHAQAEIKAAHADLAEAQEIASAIIADLPPLPAQGADTSTVTPAP